MGMAASQARYLALIARKSNCEYEGQQINQARTALSNQSANLFNQMLGLHVPVPPSTQDFTKTQYSYTDGINSSVISDWHQLANDGEYNYVVTHYYYTDRYTGSLKKLTDPQVQFSNPSQPYATAGEIQVKLYDIETTKQALEEAQKELAEAKASLSDPNNYNSTVSNITGVQYTAGTPSVPAYYTITNDQGNSNYYSLADNNIVSPTIRNNIDEILNDLIQQGVLTGEASDYHDSVYYNTSPDGSVNIAFQEDFNQLAGINGTATDLTIYDHAHVTSQFASLNANLSAKELAEAQARVAYNNAVSAYNALNVPTQLGNKPLTPLTSLTDDQLAEIKQIIEDLKAEGVDNELANCFDQYGNYLGGIFSFSLGGTTYYTTLADLQESYNSETEINDIDGQVKLNYYNASYIKTKVEETERALVETDGNGRFSSVRFENDSVTYTLNMETITDEVAYDDAMNKYIYENAMYDKMIQDINARTSIIHQQDRQLELRLKQLDTEHNALSTEIDAVQKVIKENVDKSFKTFGG